MTPLISIVIPTYNHAHYLHDALQSICAQSFSDWEAVVINNYSEDETVSIVESFIDPRIRLENFRNHGVIGASRNRGIALARGQYIAFLDSDDTWFPDKLMRCVPYFYQGADLVCHGLRVIGDREFDLYCGPMRRATFDAMLDQGSCITPSATLVRKSVLESVGGFSEDPAIVTAEDYHLWLKLTKNDVRIVVSREILGQYRLHAGNHGGDVLRTLDSTLNVVRSFIPTSSFSSWRRLKRREGLAYYAAARGMQKTRRFAEAAKWLMHSVVRRPFFIRTYAAAALLLFDLLFTKFKSQINQFR